MVRSTPGLAVVLCIAAASAHAAPIVIRNGESLHVDADLTSNLVIATGGTVKVDGNARVNGVYPETGPNPDAWTIRATANLAGGTLLLSDSARLVARSDGNAVYAGSAGHVKLEDNSVVQGLLSTDVNHVNYVNRSLTMSDQSRVEGNITWNGTVNLEDNAVVTGNLRDINGYLTLNMTGGTVQGNVQASWLGHSIFNISGGTIQGGLLCGTLDDCDIDMKGGHINNGLVINRSTRADVLITGGEIDGGVSDTAWHGHLIKILGGEFDATASGYLLSANTFSTLGSSVFDIYGGQFGYTNTGAGFNLSGNSTLNLYGWDFSFSGGRLTGFLSDGSWLDTALTFGTDWRGNLNFRRYDMAVPEPGTMALFAAGLFGVIATRRKRKLLSN